MKKKRKRIFGTIIILEVILLSVICFMLIKKGDITFNTINAKETLQPNYSEPAGQVNEGDSSADDNLQNTENATEEGRPEKEDNSNSGENTDKDSMQEEDVQEDKEAGSQDVYETITISVAGDVTLGRDKDYGYQRSFDHELELQNLDYGYFFRNVKNIFEEDDLTIVNLETTLTTAEKPAEKKFRFKADPSYVEILKQGDVDVVSVANNHTRDYLEQGYQDTLKHLETAEIGYFGYEHRYMEEIRGLKIGIAGFTAWDKSEANKERISKAIRELKEDGADIVVLMFHWGIERDAYPNDVQKELAYYSIDQGADLVLGSHPHVVQGIEEYKGKNIVYSLGNFSFGGNKNPSDKDTFVYVHKFHFLNGELNGQENEIIPCSISSVKDRNNYQPTPLEGSERERVMNKINERSQF